MTSFAQVVGKYARVQRQDPVHLVLQEWSALLRFQAEMPPDERWLLAEVIDAGDWPALEAFCCGAQAMTPFTAYIAVMAAFGAALVFVLM